jgi:DNA-binding response OmpR family regulator
MQASENRINILIVDDDRDIVSILKLGLMRQGFNVVAFTDPNLALGHFE